jgi:ABC-type sugar transport system substrate-binding protein
VVGYDAGSQADAREWFINQAAFNAIAKTLMDKLVEEKGEDASFGIVTSTFTTPNQARWIAEMQAYTEKCYPNLKYLETVEAQEDQKLSFDQANSLLNKYAGEIDGLLAMTSIATPASADAVTQADLCGQVAVVGLGLPNAMKPFVNDGCVKSVVLWNPIDLGYAAVQVMRAAVDGTLVPGATSFDAGRLGTLQVINGSEVLLGDPFVWTIDNINDYDF